MKLFNFLFLLPMVASCSMGKMINDVTTSKDQPPQYVAIADLQGDRNYAYPSEFWDTQLKKHPEIKPLVLKQAKALVFQKVVEIAENWERWELIQVEEAQFRIELIATTRLLRFKDDVVIELRDEPDGTSVHMRSKSRLGRDDFGANAKRISSFFEKLSSSLQN